MFKEGKDHVLSCFSLNVNRGVKLKKLNKIKQKEEANGSFRQRETSVEHQS